MMLKEIGFLSQIIPIAKLEIIMQEPSKDLNVEFNKNIEQKGVISD